MSEKSQRNLLLWVLAFLLFGTFFLVRDERANGKANATLSSLFFEIVQRHAGTAQLQLLLKDPKYSKLELDDRSPTIWAIETPLRYGAKNWVMYADVNGSEVRALRIRTVDSNQDHPEEAPADVTFDAR